MAKALATSALNGEKNLKLFSLDNTAKVGITDFTAKSFFDFFPILCSRTYKLRKDGG